MTTDHLDRSVHRPRPLSRSGALCAALLGLLLLPAAAGADVPVAVDITYAGCTVVEGPLSLGLTELPSEITARLVFQAPTFPPLGSFDEPEVLFYELVLGDLVMSEDELETLRIGFEVVDDVGPVVAVSELTYHAALLEGLVLETYGLCSIEVMNSFTLDVFGSTGDPCVRPPFPPPPLPASGTTTPTTDGSFRYHCTASTQTFAEVTALEPAVDVKPGSAVNPVQPGSRGLIPVAILGSEAFDVTDVDVGSLVFEGAAPAHTKGGHLEDVDGDGLTDLLSHYAIRDAEIALGQTEACVEGMLFDGTPLTGCDAIRTVPPSHCGLGAELALLLAPLGGLVRRRRRRSRPCPEAQLERGPGAATSRTGVSTRSKPAASSSSSKRGSSR